MVAIESWDKLLDNGVNVIIGAMSPEELKFGDDLTMTIRIKGETWNGFIDYRGAQFVIDLQKAITNIYQELGGPEATLREIRKNATVKVKVVEGSSIVEVKLDEVLKKMAEKISGKQITLIAGLAIVCATGYFTTSEVLKYKQAKLKSVQEKQLSETYVKEISSAMSKALDIIEKKDIEAPTRKLINKMDGNDRIQLPGKSTEESLRKEEAKKLYPPKPKVRTTSGTFDGLYRIVGINMEKRPVEFKIIENEFEFSAKAELSDTDIETIAKNLEIAMKQNEDLKVDFHLFAIYNDRGLKSASITGTGAPRPHTGNFSEQIEKWKNR